MMKESKYKYFILNHKITPTRKMGILDRIDDSSIYEVIKISDGVPLFLEEHICRMRKFADLKGIRIIESFDDIFQDICMLVEYNKCCNANLKIIRTQLGSDAIFISYFMPFEKAPLKNAYGEIHTVLFDGERQSPNVKTLGGSFRDRVMAVRNKSNAYEALLVDRDGNITEGSRSNFFFVENRKIYTPPADNVLVGVTRQKVMALCNASGMTVKEAKISARELPEIEGAFITGTTVDVLPIGSIDSMKIPSGANTIVRSVVRLYPVVA